MRLLQTLTLAAFLATCIGEPKFKQPAVCELALKCYFGIGAGATSTLEDVAGFEGLFPGGDAQLIADTYGPDGSCWRSDAVLASSCEDRCKGLLWQDCAASYERACGNDATRACLTSADCDPAGLVACQLAALPFCPQACERSNALPCRFQEFEGSSTPLFTTCPDETDCNASKNPPLPSSGCCVVPSHVNAEGEQDLIGITATECATTPARIQP